MTGPITTSQAPRTDSQMNTARDLLGQLVAFDQAQADRLVDWLGQHERANTLTRERASKLISGLIDIIKEHKAAARKAPVQTALWGPIKTRETRPEVPEGRYAIANNEGELRFYHVEVSERGRYTVRVQASDELHALPSWAVARAVLVEIQKDPKAAAIRYGLELGICGRCGRTLTNEESRSRGAGPICYGKFS